MVFFITGETKRVKKGWLSPSHLIELTALSICYTHKLPKGNHDDLIYSFLNLRYPDMTVPQFVTGGMVKMCKNAEDIIAKVAEYIRASSTMDNEITIVHGGYLNGQTLIAAMLNAGIVEQLKKPLTFYDLPQHIHAYVEGIKDSEFGPESPFTRCYDKPDDKKYSLDQKIVMFESHEKYPDKNSSFKSLMKEYEFFQQYLKEKHA